MTLHAWASRISAVVCDALFPASCVVCGGEGEWWCIRCRESVEALPHDPCSVCADWRRPHACRGTSDLSAVLATGFYHDPSLRKPIAALKYRGVTALLPSIRLYLRAWHHARIDPLPWRGGDRLAVQHLPTSPERMRQRGFDQAALIADLVITEILPDAVRLDVLCRQTSCVTQASLESHELRQANVHRSFFVRQNICIPDVILLVDDVVTSGATMREAARALKQAGAQRVYGFALALGA